MDPMSFPIVLRPRRRARALLALPLSLAGLLLGTLPCTAGAATSVAGVAFPASVAVDGTKLVENGAGLRVFFLVVQGYVSALYVDHIAHDASKILAEPGPKEIRTVFLHAASAEQLRDELGRIHDRYCAHTACGADEEHNYEELVAHETPVQAGDHETILVSDRGVTVSRNGTEAVAIADPRFGAALLRSMLGPSAPTARYRNGLLGLAG